MSSTPIRRCGWPPFAPRVPPPGGLAVASQSGAVGIAILDAVPQAGIGVSTFVSLGNKADVSGNDLLAYWYDDPATEGRALPGVVRQPPKFAWLARALARRKPVLAVKSGRSSGRSSGRRLAHCRRGRPRRRGRRAVRAGRRHPDRYPRRAAGRRPGPGRPAPAAGTRVAIIGNAGGLNVLAADAAATAGLQVVELSPALQSLLLAGSSHPAGVGNPVDLGADATAESLANAVTTLGRSGEIDSMVITYVATRVSRPASVLTALGSAVDESPSCPVVAVVVGTEPAARLGRRGIPVFHMPEDAVRALGHATDYATWRGRQRSGSAKTLVASTQPATQPGSAALRTGGGWQPFGVAADLLTAYGIPVAPSRSARTWRQPGRR